MPSVSPELFWSRVDRSAGPDGCWLWTGSKRWFGYGGFGRSRPGHEKSAHRYSYRLEHGEIPAGMFVLHRCNVPACVNPAHLYLGTQRDNIRDQITAGTFSGHVAHNPQSKLSWEQVDEIRRRFAAGVRVGTMAREFGINRLTIKKIVEGRSYRSDRRPA